MGLHTSPQISSIDFILAYHSNKSPFLSVGFALGQPIQNRLKSPLRQLITKVVTSDLNRAPTSAIRQSQTIDTYIGATSSVVEVCLHLASHRQLIFLVEADIADPSPRRFVADLYQYPSTRRSPRNMFQLGLGSVPNFIQRVVVLQR